MLKQTTANFIPFQFGEEALAASRQVWLASLGAAAVTRDWMQTEATRTFKTLVKEGTVVESRAIRFVGDRIETSVSIANSVWKETRKTVESTVKQAADTAVTIAQQVLPKSLPAFEMPGMTKARKPAKRTVKAAKKPARAVKVGKTAKRGRKTTKSA